MSPLWPLPFVSLIGYGFTQVVPPPRHQGAYDYVIIGGGTCGLVLANRLSEDPSRTVAVIEAGDSVLHDYNVSQIGDWFANLLTPIDWAYQTVPQVYTYNRTLTYNAGKALAGTSAINGGTYVRAQKAQIDAWEKLGNHGWNWKTLFPYYKMSEHLQPPDAGQLAAGASYEPSVHGYSGPVGVGWSNWTIGGNIHELLNQSWQDVGIEWKRAQSDGDSHGFSLSPNTINASLEVRADAARSYYWQQNVYERQNLDVYVNTLAEKIVWTDGYSGKGSGGLSASGVQTRPVAGGPSRIIRARKEVILSAGSLKSPVILENSGIGNPKVLAQHSIPVKLRLDSVGENLQDQPLVTLIADSKTNATLSTLFYTFATAEDLFGNNVSAVATHVLSSIPVYASLIASKNNGAYPADVVERQLRVQTDLIFNKSTPIGEIIIVPSVDVIASVFWMLLPFSRGSVHLSSTDAASMPLINPNFFQDGIDWDAIGQTGAANLVRKFWHTGPVGRLVTDDFLPNATTVPLNASVDEWLPFFKQTYSVNNHPIGTCAMMAKDIGGVVDAELMVFGTSNVRVVDASILPFQIDGHLTSTLYAVSERASDLISGKLNGRYLGAL